MSQRKNISATKLNARASHSDYPELTARSKELTEKPKKVEKRYVCNEEMLQNPTLENQQFENDRPKFDSKFVLSTQMFLL